MKKHAFIASTLASATCTLLGASNVLAAMNSDSLWEFDSAFLIYSEPDRVSALEPTVSAKRETTNGGSLFFKGVIDSLTGTSANGAVPTDRAKAFTRPSGDGNYTINTGGTPLDDTYHDTRLAISSDWETPLSQTMRLALGGNISNEFDYMSASASARLLKDFNQKNTTLSVGLAHAEDTIEPEGGIPEALGLVSEAEFDNRANDDDNSVTDLLFGVTQIIDQNSFFQVNYGLTDSNGYHTDPYKLVSLVDGNGRPFGDNSDIPSVIYENRPEDRARHSLFGRYKRKLDSGDMLDLSYRYSTDDWEIDTHTVDIKYRFDLTGNRYIQPHFRFYTQSEAEFYRPFLLQGEGLPEFASADYRLADMDTFTIGAEYGWGNKNNPWRVSLEYYLQEPTEPGNKFGELENQELLPSVDAILLRVNKRF